MKYLLVVLIGVFLGLSAFTFRYAEGLSYFSEDPRACVNCHIMRPQYDSWQKSSHHNVAGCVECHLPKNFPDKYISKAENGYHHSKGFTLQDFHEPILMTSKNRKILQQNCLRCHGDLVHDLAPAPKNPDQALSCVHCHKGVGHGETVGMGKIYSNEGKGE